MGVVCSMWVWSVQCGCGLFNVGVVCSIVGMVLVVDIMLVLNIMGSPWIDQLNAI